jgi:hypothetical protein
MKMSESSGNPITEKTAKGIVRKYGKGKDYLSIEDCLKINERFSTKNPSKSQSKGKK